MLTRCPRCKTAFRVSAEQLRAARGRVQCGRCYIQFDAIEYLHDDPVEQRPESVAVEQPPPAGEPLPPVPGAVATTAARQPELAPAIATAREDARDDIPLGDLDLDAPAPAATPEATAEDILLADMPPLRNDADDSEPSAGVIDLPEPPAAAPRSVFWGVLAAVLLLTLIGQVAWYEREILFEAQPELRALVERLCRGRFCELPPRRDLAAMQILSRDVREHPRFKDALLVNATLVNKADFAQPFPTLQLVLYDRSGSMVAARRFEPAEYPVCRSPAG
jgi:predicted Zn finger-like uncharacterized protein